MLSIGQNLICDGLQDALSRHSGFYLTLGSVVVASFGSGVQQSSFYGLAGMLPPKYTMVCALPLYQLCSIRICDAGEIFDKYI